MHAKYSSTVLALKNHFVFKFQLAFVLVQYLKYLYFKLM